MLKQELATLGSIDTQQLGGLQPIAEMLNVMDKNTEKAIMSRIEERDPILAEEIRKLMFVFEDIVQLEDKAIQSILKEVDIKDLATALKGMGGEVQEKIFKNMSERAVGMLKEDMEFMGPVRLRVVEESQQKVVAIIRRLEEAGEIVIGRTGEEDILV